MTICLGVPKETKPLEGRVALTPTAVAELVDGGCKVLIQSGAGVGSGFVDDDYARAGAMVVYSADSLYGAAELVVKVKEPVGRELEMLQGGQRLFSYLHLAANPELTEALCRIGLTAIAFETVVDGGNLPLLQPMSEIAGRQSVRRRQVP